MSSAKKHQASSQASKTKEKGERERGSSMPKPRNARGDAGSERPDRAKG